MRTTIDLPPAVHRRAREIAAERGQSMSTVVAELTSRGLAQLDEPVSLTIDSESGFPTLSVGRKITARDVEQAMDDE